MADHYPLIERAVTGLDKNTGENRRALYDRARAALVSQLRGVVPALDETDITRERLALEEAIRKVEAETAKRPRMEHETEAGEASLRDRGLRDFRETVAEAEGLGSAAAEARRAAHETYDAMPEGGPHYFEPQKPARQSRLSEPPLTEETLRRGYVPQPPPAYDDDDETYARPARSYAGLVKWAILLAVLAGIAGAVYWQRHAITSMVAGFRSQPASKP